MLRMSLAPALALSTLLSCTPADGPIEPELEAAFSISDGSRADGNTHFYFLPPLVPAPDPAGVFDATAAPVVSVCALAADVCAAEVARFEIGSGSAAVRMVPEDEHYIVDWHTVDYELDTAVTYRISVSVGGQALGHADVDVVTGGRELKNVDTGEFVALKDGRTLPIKFRIEEGAVTVDPCLDIRFASPGVEAVVRADLGIPSGTITPTDVVGYRRMVLPAVGIADLGGVECLTDLAHMVSYGNPIADLSPLADLLDIIEVGAGAAALTDLSPLAGLTGTIRLDLRSNQITDLSPLADLTALEIVLFDGNPFTDLSPLAGATAMRWLTLYGVPVTDLSPLAGMTAMQRLILGQSGVADLGPLSAMTVMDYLNIDFLSVADFSPLSAMTALTRLEAQSVGLPDLTAIAGAAGMRHLSIPGNPLSDLSPLAGMPDLSWLRVSGTAVSDLSPLLGLTSLAYLDVRTTAVSCMDPDLATLRGQVATVDTSCP